MTYQIFRIYPNNTIEHEHSCPDFPAANKYIKKRRKELVTADNYRLKMVFAPNAEAGKKILAVKREYVPEGDD